MEGAPLHNQERFDSEEGSDIENPEIFGDELQIELAKEAGHIVINPFHEDHGFSHTNDNEDDDDDNL